MAETPSSASRSASRAATCSRCAFPWRTRTRSTRRCARETTRLRAARRGRRVPRRARARAVRQALRARGARRLRLVLGSRGPRGRDRRPAAVGEDHALQCSDPRWSLGSRREGARRHGADRRRTPRLRSRTWRARRRPRRPRSACRTCPASAPRCSATSGVSTRSCARLDGFSPGADPARDLEQLELELLVADRDHVEARLERVRTQAKSGDPRLRTEAGALELLLAHLDAGGALRRLRRGDCPRSSSR